MSVSLQVLEGIPVTDIKTESTWLGRRRVVDVETPYGNIKTKHVVNCTGVWANYIAAMVNIFLRRQQKQKHFRRSKVLKLRKM